MIPGFNNSAGNAQASFDAIAKNLAERQMLGRGCAYDVAIGIEWPGRTAAGYWLAEASARRSADKLREIVLKLRPRTLSIEAHSLGNLVALHANRDGGLGVTDLVLTNAAVDDECVERGQTYFTAVDSIKGNCLILYSRNDDVLGRDYRWMGSVPRNLWGWVKNKFSKSAYGDGGFGDHALGWGGPEHGRELVSRNVTALDGTPWCLSHSGARDAAEFYSAWGELLK
jgi:hypothetical protein